jgi:hypothetical protein
MHHRLISGCIVVACAQFSHASLIGGALVTDASWNATASATIGQQVTVYRLFFTFDDPSDTLLNVFDVTMFSGHTLYQDPTGGFDLPPNPSFFSLIPELEWDSYVSIGALTGPSSTARDPDFAFAANGVLGGWFTSDPPSEEGASRAPGGADINGAPVIPASFDLAYSYVFGGQFTVLGAIDPGRSAPVLDGGYIDSDIFSGLLSMTINSGFGDSTAEFALNVPIGIPTPGAGVAFALAGCDVGARRRR